MLVMTATPIPRTLALTVYGDLDVSVIDQLPPGRQKIITRWRSGARRDEAYRLIAQQVSEGRQAFIICPLIEESESLAVKAATVEYERLSREVFPNLRLGLVHGAMKAAEKDQVMRRFRDGELDMADLNDIRLVELSRNIATKLWETDPYLRKPEHAALRERMHLFWQSYMGH